MLMVCLAVYMKSQSCLLRFKIFLWALKTFLGIATKFNTLKDYLVSSFLLLATQHLQDEIETKVTDGNSD